MLTSSTPLPYELLACATAAAAAAAAGKDWTVPELWELCDYNCHLKNRCGDS
jgi:hypothetical protein